MLQLAHPSLLLRVLFFRLFSHVAVLYGYWRTNQPASSWSLFSLMTFRPSTFCGSFFSAPSSPLEERSIRPVSRQICRSQNEVSTKNRCVGINMARMIKRTLRIDDSAPRRCSRCHRQASTTLIDNVSVERQRVERQSVTQQVDSTRNDI